MIYEQMTNEQMDITKQINDFLEMNLFASVIIQQNVTKDNIIYSVFARTYDYNPTYIKIQFPSTEKTFENPVSFVTFALWNNPKTKESIVYDVLTDKKPETNDEIAYLAKLITDFLKS